MPTGTCDPATRGDAFNAVTLELPLPNQSGSVLVDIRFGWDGVSVRPDCDGPVSRIRTRNNGTQTAWALLPGKKKGNPWVRIDPGDDLIVTAQAQLNNLGLTNYTDVAGVDLVFTNPGAI